MQRRGTFSTATAARIACGFTFISLMLALPGRADILYNNLGNAQNAGYTVGLPSVYGPAYQGFTTGGSVYELTSVTVGLFYDGNDSQTYSAYIYSDVGGAPGSELAYLGTNLDSTLTCCAVEDDITFNSPAGVFLAPTTSYFVYLTGSGPDNIHNALWAAANDDSGIGVAGAPGMGGAPAVMEVQASTVSPEPGAGLLLGIGLGLFLVLTRKRRLTSRSASA